MTAKPIPSAGLPATDALRVIADRASNPTGDWKVDLRFVSAQAGSALCSSVEARGEREADEAAERATVARDRRE